MEIYIFQDDVTVFGVHVKTFPNGIKEAFDGLVSLFGNNRAYCGISWMEENDCVEYYATLPESFKGEANNYPYEKLLIMKGEYRAETIYNWFGKLDSLKEVFHRLMAGNRPDKNHPCVEWYKSDIEMLCMAKA